MLWSGALHMNQPSEFVVAGCLDNDMKHTTCVSCLLLDAGCQRTCKLKLMQKNMLMLHKLMNRLLHLLILSRASCVICGIVLPLVG
jgi:hypothetical protein